MNEVTEKPTSSAESTSISVKYQRRHFPSLQTALEKAKNTFYSALHLQAFTMENWENLTIIPSVDIIDDEEGFKVEVEMPGISAEDVNVSVKDGTVLIKAEKKPSSKNKGKNYIMREIGFGYYERSIHLPNSVEVENAKASFKKSMLWIEIPKKEGFVKQSKELLVEELEY